MGTLQEALAKKLRMKKDPETNEKMPQKGEKTKAAKGKSGDTDHDGDCK